MSGHSKWSTIKRKKELKDQQRGAIFSKLSRIITLAVVDGGGVTDPAGNVKLRIAIERARSANMPKANIDRAIEKAKKGGENLKEVVYEGFGPEGVAMIISALTDNPNRTISLIKTALEKNGGKLGSENSVKYQFTKCAVVEFENKHSEDDVLAFADRISSIDIESDESGYYVYVPFERMGYVSDYLEGLTTKSIDVYYLPKNIINISPSGQAKLARIVEILEELLEVDGVYFNT